MGLHAAIIRLSPLIHEGEQRYKPHIVGDPRIVSLSVTSPMKNPGYAPASYDLFRQLDSLNNFNVTSTRYRNGMKIGNFVFTLTNVRFYVLPMREIILAILTSSLVVRFSLTYPGTPKRRKL